ncbi:MAG: aminotransferase class I/II-fold pyridoxal phosphate-dependent enzyme [Chloroflexi bacterium]|nr:aminotransferase class I/II-fold pyridoxal phosphate-dependent enzyme [Chloroflexota bacterium]MBM3174321.1 aminotransferase class I/II-fold pyridoxal phosphate-dependent enzyme [Chloroflexota bacterium]MBM4449452.1 aminotransferase class I/II-fold pyridoxal phosphate-dependent enzyme [Chloroflexota bacterium]
MAALNAQAKELNQILKTHNAAVLELLSKRGKAIYFPAKGILAQGMAAKGKEINATIGTAYEDDGKPMIISSIARYFEIDSKDVFPYAPSEGIKPLRDKWKELIKAKNPSLNAQEISVPVVTCGVTNGLSIVGYMFVEETDDIILSDLYWENYDLVFTNAYGAKLKFFNLFRGKNFDVDSFRRTVISNAIGKRMVLLNFPNNPSGYTPTAEEAEAIANVLTEAAEAGNKLVVILDDSYFGLVFDDAAVTESLFSKLAHAHRNILAVKVDGITKEEYAWGLRVGFVTYSIRDGNKELYKALEDKTAGAVRGNISNSPHASQFAALHALNSEAHEQEKQANKKKILERYLKVKDVLKAHSEYAKYFEALPFNSGYFMCVRLKGLDPDKVWEALLNKYSTGVICYSEKSLLRIAFASTPLDKIEKLFNNIYLACEDCAST